MKDGLTREDGAKGRVTGRRGRLAASVREFQRAFLANLLSRRGRSAVSLATRNDLYMALAFTVRDRMLLRWIGTAQKYERKAYRVVGYLSAEFLVGPHRANNLVSIGYLSEAREAMSDLGLDLDEILAQEEEPGLGNGGLGRLAACYLDSLATLEVPAIGYGIRYEFGIFDQTIRDGWQVEVTDKWLRFGNPWEIERPELCFPVGFGGRTETWRDGRGRHRVRWVPDRVVKGVACDTPIPGYQVNTVNLLRLWKAEAVESFDFQAFNVGDYYDAVDEKMASENLTKVLYPNDEPIQGKQLRLEQQYFFVSCSLRDMLRLYSGTGKGPDRFHEMFAVQLNDTHPSIAVAELMRLLVDEHEMEWDAAWHVTQRTFSYTNHTLLPEALERWPVSLIGRLLPRHLEIIYEINRRFLDDVRARYPGDDGKVARLSLIDESGPRSVRMAHLACVGSHTVNGVAALHTELLKQTVTRDFAELWPDKFRNVTNGVTPRRFMLLSNPGLADLITRHVGAGWITDLDELSRLEPLADDPGFREDWRRVKLDNKRALADVTRERTGIEIDPDSLFDIQSKRIHEYKRQHLNVLHIVTLYLHLKKNPAMEMTPRTFIFSGKAAPGYFMAKLIIKLINSVADVVNNDPEVRGRLKVAFLPDYNVKNAEAIFPAADLSEQISTAGKEASGTGNMKFSLNGALTIGTLDGANVEIREAVGAENFFLFGATAEQVGRLKGGRYRPRRYYEGDPRLRETVDAIASGRFSKEDGSLFRPLTDELLHHDTFMLLHDYSSYLECQAAVSEAYCDMERWTRMSILNVARMGRFSSDRAIREYCQHIWKTGRLPDP